MDLGKGTKVPTFNKVSTQKWEQVGPVVYKVDNVLWWMVWTQIEGRIRSIIIFLK